jgi:hypothetical protein
MLGRPNHRSVWFALLVYCVLIVFISLIAPDSSTSIRLLGEFRHQGIKIRIKLSKKAQRLLGQPGTQLQGE